MILRAVSMGEDKSGIVEVLCERGCNMTNRACNVLMWGVVNCTISGGLFLVLLKVQNEKIDEDVGEDLNLSEAVIGKLKLFERG